MKKRSIALNLHGKTYGAVIQFTKNIYEGFLDNTSIYPSPTISTADQLTDIQNAYGVLLKWGKKGARGSHHDLILLRQACDKLKENLKVLAAYCMSVTPNDIIAWGRVGFIEKHLPEKAPLSAPPMELHQVTDHVLKTTIKLRWKRPLETPRRRSLVYKVIRSETDDFAQIKELATVTKATFTDYKVEAGVIYYYKIIPVNAYGNGVASNMLPARAWGNL